MRGTRTPSLILVAATPLIRIIMLIIRTKLMESRHVEAESITHKYYNSSTKPKFYKTTRLVDKIIKKTSLAKFYSKHT